MVAPIGYIVNKFIFPSTFNTSTMTNSQEFVLPTVFPANCTGIDFPTGFVPVNSFEIRGRTFSTEKNLSRDSSMSSTQSSIIYHERMANNSMDVDQEPTIKSPALSYEMEQEKALHLSKATETLDNTRPQNRNNEATLIQPECAGHVNQGERQQHDAAPNDDDDNVINIQLPYDPNLPTEPELWSGNFHLISLHGSIEQIASDTKSIKDLLNFIARYISKQKGKFKQGKQLTRPRRHWRFNLEFYFYCLSS